MCYALSSLMLINTLLDWGKLVVRFWRRVDFYPFTGRYPGVDAHTLLLRAADEQPGYVYDLNSGIGARGVGCAVGGAPTPPLPKNMQ